MGEQRCSAIVTDNPVASSVPNGSRERHAQGRMVSVLEGGSALSALGRSVVQHVRVLAGLDA